MQKKIENLNLTPIDNEDLLAIEGGSFWRDVAYAAAATVKFIGYAFKDAVEHPIRPSEYR
ncbi:MAG: hypothetical protein QM763_02775 [Agriterribacter sp.]